MSVNNIKIKSGAGFTLQNFSKKNLGGFTLLEMIIALFIITVGIGGVVALINQSLIASQITASKLVASYLAQEGIELVRNIRDTNWLQGIDWLANNINPNPNSKEIIDYKMSSLLDSSRLDDFICLGLAEFYYYNGPICVATPGTTPTPYQRTISVILIDGNSIRVISEVKWKERGREHVITVEEILYDWK